MFSAPANLNSVSRARRWSWASSTSRRIRFPTAENFWTPDAAVAHALELVAQGAEILDIGGESTRPGAGPVGEAEEFRRVLPVIEQLAATTKSRSRLTRSSRPLPAPRLPPAPASSMMSAPTAKATRCGRSSRNFTPATFACTRRARRKPCSSIRFTPTSCARSANFFTNGWKRADAGGIAAEQVALDPGIGFGKTLEHNLQLLANLRSFTKWRRPLLLGVSRKSFIEKLSGAKLNERLPASLACATLAVAVRRAPYPRA